MTLRIKGEGVLELYLKVENGGFSVNCSDGLTNQTMLWYGERLTAIEYFPKNMIETYGKNKWEIV